MRHSTFQLFCSLCDFWWGFCFTKRHGTEPICLRGRTCIFIHSVFSTLTVTIMKSFLTFSSYLICACKCPLIMLQVSQYCRAKLPFPHSSLSCLQFLFIKRKFYLFNFLYCSLRVPLITAIHSNSKRVNGLIALGLQSLLRKVLFWLNLFI